MRTLAVRGLTRLSAPGVPLLMSFVLGGAVLLGASAPAWAEGRVTFVQMTAQRCAEGGGCEWKLSCGPQGQEKELFAGKEARTKHSVTINQGVDVRTFPVTIQCTVWEDDGIFGATWDKVGTGTVVVPSGGDYRLDIGNPDEGTVRIRIIADSLEIGIPAPAAAKPGAKPAPPLQFVGAFNQQKEGQAVLLGMEWDKFKARMDELSGYGIQLFAVSSFEHGGKRLWNGIFRPSGEEMVLLSNQDSEKFVDSYKRVTGGRKRLVDMEVYPSGGKLLFASLYRDMPNLASDLWLGQSRKDFQDKIKELASLKGRQVLDVEVYRSGNSLLYAGPFLQSGEPTEVWTGLEQGALQSKWDGLNGKEWKVVDVETYKDGNKRLFDAVARAGARGGLAVGLNQGAFLIRWRQMTSGGLRLTSVDVYQD
ncbi:MAG TPA: hypothetical protein VG477_10595 [Thermoanaerobaculia bacterium]|nr:hypothetical protein [Thermoanaerobaculia bacterium]